MNRELTISRRTVECAELSRPGLDTPAGAEGVVGLGGVPVVTGRVRELRVRPGLTVYTADVRDEQNLEVRGTLQPGLLLVLPLTGEADVSYGGCCFQLGHQGGGDARSRREGLALALTRPEGFARRLRRGACRRVVSLMLASQWLADNEEALSAHPGLVRFRTTHLAARHWRLTPRLLALAADLIELRLGMPPLMRLYLESRCLEIIAEGLGSLSGSEPMSACTMRPRERRRLAQFREFLDSGEGDGWSLQALADRIGMSPSTLQRYFRAYTGMSVFAYQRRRLLDVARIALEREGISVNEAAHRAGYTSAANFATAFRRQFGIAPSQLRRRN